MDFRSELAKWGYNKGNSIDVETLIDEILPSLLSKQERSYSEEEVLELLEKIQQQVAIDYNDEFLFAKEWFEQFKRNKKEIRYEL